MATTACPSCGAAADLPAGGSTTCGCGTDFWQVPGAATGEAFTGIANDRAGTLTALWTMVAAGGVLAALLGILAAEAWGVAWIVRRLTA
ncbi:MAG: hypothetical protein ACYTGX_06975 [Planctomycetota bacterium]|jgi:hypothetical protein